MRNRLLLPLLASLLLAATLPPSVALAQLPGCPPGFWDFYCDDLRGCNNCINFNGGPLEMAPWQDELLDYGSGYTTCMNWPRGWADYCWVWDVVGEYDMVVTVQYANAWSGARFEVQHDGKTIGVTDALPGWGYPWPGPGVGYTVGVFGNRIACGINRITVKEITMQAHSLTETCIADMNIIHVKLKFDFYRPGSFSKESIPIASTTVPLNGPSALRIAPNPSSGMVFLQARSGERTAGTASLGIYDLRGAKVWSTSGNVDAGNITNFRWDGRSDQGSRVSNGVYFVRGMIGGTEVRSRLIRMAGAPGTSGDVLAANAIVPANPEAQPAASQPAPGRHFDPRYTPNPNLPPEEGGSGGGGGGTPPPAMDLDSIIERIKPFVRFNVADSTFYLDHAAANSAGIDPVSQSVGDAIMGFLTNFLKNLGKKAAWWVIHQGMTILFNQIEQYIVDLPGGSPCGEFKNPAPCPTYHCLLPSPKGSRLEVITALAQAGYTEADPGLFDGKDADTDLFAKPHTIPNCNERKFRKLAIVYRCGPCAWNAYEMDNYVPDTNGMKLSDFALWAPDSGWAEYVAWWYFRHCFNPAPKPTCCTN